MTDAPFNNRDDQPSNEDIGESKSSNETDCHPPAPPAEFPPAQAPKNELPAPNNAEEPKQDYEVGYAKPPKQHQFKKGNSGNKKGRPKGRRDFKTDLEENLASKVKVNKNGRQVKLTRQQLIIEAQTTKAAKGDPRSADMIFGLIHRYFTEDPNSNADIPISAEEHHILEEFAARFTKPPTTETDPPPAVTAEPEPIAEEQPEVSDEEPKPSNDGDGDIPSWARNSSKDD